MNLIDIASQYFTLKRNSSNSWAIDQSEFDSVILFESTNTYCRFSTGETGDVYYFLKNIVGLTTEQIAEYDLGHREVKLSYAAQMNKYLRKPNHSIRQNELDYHAIIGTPGYNDYIAQRNINEETAKKYGLEIDGPDVIFPLFDDNLNRIGCIKRFAYAEDKNDRYRTYVLSGHNKPYCWDMVSLSKLTTRTTVILVEGTWSVLRISQVVGDKYNILPIATMGTEIQQPLLDAISANRVIAILDNDTGGANVKKQLTKARNAGMLVTTVDINNRGKNVYIDDISDKQMIYLFSQIMRNG